MCVFEDASENVLRLLPFREEKAKKNLNTEQERLQQKSSKSILSRFFFFVSMASSPEKIETADGPEMWAVLNFPRECGT